MSVKNMRKWQMEKRKQSRLVLLLLVTPLWAWSAEPMVAKGATESAPDWQIPAMPESMPYAPLDLDGATIGRLEEDWGVRLLGMRLTASDYMIDFRFHVTDAEKAITLFDHRIKPHIVVERSNAVLPVPMAAKVGALRPTNRGKNIMADRNYYMIFGNPDRHVKSGDKVTVVIGDFAVEHLTVH
jgi:hypothetical protein